jgi:hypothetical protein
MIATSATTQIWQNKALRPPGHRQGRHGFSAGLQIRDDRRELHLRARRSRKCTSVAAKVIMNTSTSVIRALMAYIECMDHVQRHSTAVSNRATSSAIPRDAFGIALQTDCSLSQFSEPSWVVLNPLIMQHNNICQLQATRSQHKQ